MTRYINTNTAARRRSKRHQSFLLLIVILLLFVSSNLRVVSAKSTFTRRIHAAMRPRVVVSTDKLLHFQLIQQLPFLRIRGGGDSWQNAPSQSDASQSHQSSPGGQPLTPSQQQQYSDSSQSHAQPLQPPPPPPPATSAAAAASLSGIHDENENGAGDDPFHESVQDRVNEWKMRQREIGTATMDSARDEQGRVKLLTSVSKGSRVIIFFCLMWRDIHLFEVADQNFSKKSGSILRLLMVVPLVFLFVANMAGALLSLMTSSPSHAAKKRLKAILNLDKILEAALIVYCLLRLTIAPSKYTPRELYVASTFHSVFFIAQCQTFTRLSWEEHSARPATSYSSRDPTLASSRTTSSFQQQEQLDDEDSSQRLQQQQQQQQQQQEHEYYNPLLEQDVWYDDGEGGGGDGNSGNTF